MIKDKNIFKYVFETIGNNPRKEIVMPEIDKNFRWPTNIPTKNQIKIICAAIKLGDIVFPCFRHWDDKCRIMIKKIISIEDVKKLISNGKEVQGFIGTDGKFYDRKKAAKIFNQYSEKKVGKLLFSEDLY